MVFKLIQFKARRKNQLGVTLLELMVVVAIVSILATLAAPSFSTMLDRNRLKGAANTLYADMQFARSESVKLDRTVVLSFTRTNATQWCYGMTVTAAGCECTTANSCQLEGAERVVNSSDVSNMALTVAGDVSFGTVLTPGTSTSFNPLRGTAEAGTVQLTSPLGKQVQVVLSPLSRVRYCSPAGANKIFDYPDC